MFMESKAWKSAVMVLGVCPKTLLSAAQEGPQEAPSYCRGLRASLWAVVLEPVVLKALVSTFLERQWIT